MRRVLQIIALFTVVSFFLINTAPGKTLPAREAPEDKTLSPYFFVKSDDAATDQFPLKATSSTVNISGVIADVLVTQIYKNEGKKALEAIYIFPASTRAAVYGMKMTIGQRIIEAKIKKRDEARREYENARNEGKSASLLEQQRPNVFQMNVANIIPGDEVKVELRYSELLVPADNIYEFVYPTVVGPRYSNQKEEIIHPYEKWIQNPYLHQDEAPVYTFDMRVTISAGMAVGGIYSPSHKINTTFSSPSMAAINLDKSESHGGNRDYVLRYRLAGEKIQSGLLLYEGEKENFFLLMMQPPKNVTKAQIPGREYIFIVDVSGSMYGFPLEISKRLLKNLIGNLRPTDLFNVLLFSGGSAVMSDSSLPATPENMNRAINLIEQQQGGGGTELLPALKRALSLKKAKGYSRSIVIATDGYVTVEEEVFDLIRNNLGDSNMFAFGIGTSVNRHIIEGMAHVGMGEPFIITKPEEAISRAERFRAMIQSPVLTKVKVSFSGFSAYDIDPVNIPDVLAERPVIVFGKYRGKPMGTIRLSGSTGEGSYAEAIDVSGVKPLKTNSALRYLWARHRITILSDYNKLRSDDGRIKEVTNLGLAYNLLTAYTSFVAIDTEVRNADGNFTTVKQPLPLPQGVSDYAIGGMGMKMAALPFMAQLKAPTAYDKGGVQEKWVTQAKVQKKAGVRAGDIAVSKGLAKAEVQKVVEEHMGEIERCLPANSQGKVVLTISTDQDGKVTSVKITSSYLKNKGVEQCIIEEAKTWQFPNNTDGLPGRITITFTVGA